ncbi:MAG: hypothetical protein QOD65_1315, partial [Gaiellales bacterium]|nr:hypothetical protein [Gaiellales bacterium]
MNADFDIVIPTLGRPSLERLLQALAQVAGRPPGRVVIVDDSRDSVVSQRARALPGGRIQVVTGRRRGPAAARNTGWRACGATWVEFLDDDVEPPAGWLDALADDLAGLDDAVAASEGGVRVPLPRRRRATDWERGTQGLERARYVTADIAYRRTALQALGGFDERFERAYREDADIALRTMAAGFRIARGTRRVVHPVRPPRRFESIRRQAGNADDARMDGLHGARWRERAHAPRGRRSRHVALTVLAAAGLARPRRARRIAAVAWATGTAEFAWSRIAPGPRNPREIGEMLITSIAIPPAATGWWLAGLLRRRRLSRVPAAVLFDRDGTLIEDVPY